MVKMLFALLIFGITCCTVVSQNSAPIPNRSEKMKPTVYIDVDCQSKTGFQLRLHNNTAWAIAVPTFSLYFSPKNVITTKLMNGKTVFPLPSNRDISSLYYYVERDKTNSNIDVPQMNYSDSFNESWITSKDSIQFSIPKEQLREGLQIYVPFNYEWELNEQGIIYNEPIHRVFFRGIDLRNPDKLPNCPQ